MYIPIQEAANAFVEETSAVTTIIPAEDSDTNPGIHICV